MHVKVSEMTASMSPYAEYNMMSQIYVKVFMQFITYAYEFKLSFYTKCKMNFNNLLFELMVL